MRWHEQLCLHNLPSSSPSSHAPHIPSYCTLLRLFLQPGTKAAPRALTFLLSPV